MRHPSDAHEMWKNHVAPIPNLHLKVHFLKTFSNASNTTVCTQHETKKGSHFPHTDFYSALTKDVMSSTNSVRVHFMKPEMIYRKHSNFITLLYFWPGETAAQTELWGLYASPGCSQTIQPSRCCRIPWNKGKKKEKETKTVEMLPYRATAK